MKKNILILGGWADNTFGVLRQLEEAGDINLFCADPSKYPSVHYSRFCKKGYKIPDPSDYNALIVMGGPMNVYETDEFPYLIEEEKFRTESILVLTFTKKAGVQLKEKIARIINSKYFI